MKTAFLIPVGGGLVRDPLTKNPLPKTGAVMPLSTYWKRRLMFGEVVIGNPPKEKSEVKKTVFEKKEVDE